MEENPQPPVVAPCANVQGPFWSVMIPTYNPAPHYLEATLRGVLEQDPGPEQMQIEVLDDASANGGVESLVREVGRHRIGFFRQPRTMGMAGNWNTAVRRSRGRWIHILHQDDLVLPGFYRHLRQAIENCSVLGAAVVQQYLINEDGRRLRLVSHVPAQEPGILRDWLKYVFVELSFQTPAIVVRRAVYEHLGGFRTDFRYALDWDMWKRIAASYPIWFDPTPLACYRRHRQGATAALLATGENMVEVRRSIELSRSYLPPELAEDMACTARRHYTEQAIDSAIYSLFTRGDPRAALQQLRQARNFESRTGFWRLSLRRLRAGFARWRVDRTR